ncbi:MAG: DNA cytosine methyltransferase, partial [Campylobacterales bacterium]|nr:DNA cytosine methyltransferase [Campylobacterales bacterium]
MPNYISLFSSAGVGCYGFKELGYDCIATAEILQKRLDIQKLNNKCKYSSGYISGDLRELATHKALENEINFFKESEKVKDIDVIIATPPCQGMSVANHKKKNELLRNSLVVESIKITAKYLPRFFIFENVSGFLRSICTDTDGQDKPIKEAIYRNLSSEYLIDGKVLNLKNYGSNSSRTRTIVIGVRRDQDGITPLDLFPEYQTEKTLKEVIGHLPALKNMGEFDEDDLYHNFRPYQEHMRPWISSTKYGQSAFENDEIKLKPHRVINGEVVINQNKNGDKYKRQVWEKVAPCIHTRNDCLPSQNTIHPVDDRVFSIRELMLMMTIPSSFKWVDDSELPSREASYEEKNKFRKSTDVNIRQCIGEAVPTQVISNIAQKTKHYLLNVSAIPKAEIEQIIKRHELKNFANLKKFIEKNYKKIPEDSLLRICDLANSIRQDTGAFYTNKQISFTTIEHLPDFKKDSIKILEPSVGAGVFLVQISRKYPDKELIIDCVDINKESLEVCKTICEKLIKHPRMKINYHCSDFLEWKPAQKQYDLVIGNPPFMKVKDSEKLLRYKRNSNNRKTNNIFSFFIEKSNNLGRVVSLILPKSFLNSPEYQGTREVIEKNRVIHINDFNEKAFDVKIETISITFDRGKKNRNTTSINSYLLKKFFTQKQSYITE